MRLLVFILFSLSLYSQGFDWQINNRLPFKVADLYLGGNIFYNDESMNTDFTFIDGEDGMPCCNFEEGSGSGYGFGFAAEYWFRSNLAFNSNLNIMISNSEFINTVSIPTSPDEELINDFIYSLSRNRLEYTLGFKWRTPFYKFNLGVNLVNSFFLSSNESYRERVTFPNGLVDERNVEQGEIPNFSSYVFIPQLTISKDVSIKNNIYSSIYLRLGTTFINELSYDSWNSNRLSLGFNIYYGLN